MIERDKLLHMLFGAAVAAVALLVIWLSKNASVEAAMILATGAAGVGYELTQMISKGGVADLEDVVFTLIGGAAMTTGLSIWAYLT